VDAHRLIAVLGDEALPGFVPVRAQAAAVQQILVWLAFPFDGVASEVVPERRFDDRVASGAEILEIRGQAFTRAS
jgi:hypothetical protein